LAEAPYEFPKPDIPENNKTIPSDTTDNESTPIDNINDNSTIPDTQDNSTIPDSVDNSTIPDTQDNSTIPNNTNDNQTQP
jgi:hypothetical protein